MSGKRWITIRHSARDQIVTKKFCQSSMKQTSDPWTDRYLTNWARMTGNLFCYSIFNYSVQSATIMLFCNTKSQFIPTNQRCLFPVLRTLYKTTCLENSNSTLLSIWLAVGWQSIFQSIPKLMTLFTVLTTKRLTFIQTEEFIKK